MEDDRECLKSALLIYHKRQMGLFKPRLPSDGILGFPGKVFVVKRYRDLSRFGWVLDVQQFSNIREVDIQIIVDIYLDN